MRNLFSYFGDNTALKLSCGGNESISSLSSAASKEDALACRAINQISEELVCPITHKLPVDPVVAEDGRIYERQAIEEYFRWRQENRSKDGNHAQGGLLAKSGLPFYVESPYTKKKIGLKLLPLVQVRNIVRHLAESGLIEDGFVVENVKKGKSGVKCFWSLCWPTSK